MELYRYILVLTPLILHIIANIYLKKRGLLNKYHTTNGKAYCISIILTLTAIMALLITACLSTTSSSSGVFAAGMSKASRLFGNIRMILFIFLVIPYYISGFISAFFLIFANKMTPEPNYVKQTKLRPVFHFLGRMFYVLFLLGAFLAAAGSTTNYCGCHNITTNSTTRSDTDR